MNSLTLADCRESPTLSIQMTPRGVLRIMMITSLTAARSAGAQSVGSTDNSYGYLASFNSSMAIVIVFLLGAFFLMGFFSVYLRRCAETRVAASPPYSAAAARTARPRRLGLDSWTIESFPIVTLGERVWNSAECAICLGEFGGDETLRLIPKCSHVFHSECIDAWLSSHVTCPVCRRQLEAQKETTPFQGGDDEVAIDVEELIERRRSIGRSHSAGHLLSRLEGVTWQLKRCSSYDVVLPVRDDKSLL